MSDLRAKESAGDFKKYFYALMQSLAKEHDWLVEMVDYGTEDFDSIQGHLVFAEVTPWIERMWESEPNHAEVRQFLSKLDVAYAAGDEYTNDVLDGSLVENLNEESPLIDELGPNLRASPVAQFRWSRP